jgi:hypothetical protein
MLNTENLTITHRNSVQNYHMEKPRVFDPRGRVALTPSGEIVLTL